VTRIKPPALPDGGTELSAPLGIPAIATVPVGHGKHMATIPLGVRARIDADAKTPEIVESAVA
jgi:muramoyltetrapeptide carboxypeptidase